jgi:ATP-dependent RNA helicase DHX37/DHR1
MPPKFVPRERKHRKLAKLNAGVSRPSGDANATEIAPTTKAEKDERRRKLQEELRAQQPESKVSAKRRKRLDKYVDTKLKKEENLELLKKLAAQKVDTSLYQSAKKLGRVHETKKERFSRALQEQQAGIDVDGQRDTILFEPRFEQPASDKDASGAPGDYKGSSFAENAAKKPTTAPSTGGLFGSGLKRPLETDESGRPVIKKRKRQKKETKKPDFTIRLPSPSDQEDFASEAASDEWSGFDSDDNEELVPEGSHGIESDNGSTHSDDESSSESSGTVEESDDDTDVDGLDRPARVSAFKAWADSQRNEAVGFTPSALPSTSNNEAIKSTFKPRALSPDAERSATVAQPSEDAYRPGGVVVISRAEDIQEGRLKLPVVQEEQKIIEAIHNNPVTIVCGATGSGKTTQLPQMLLENGYGAKGTIAVTQPRRVAATSVAARVKHELGPEYGAQVAHQVRYDSSVGRDTRIKFMTDGILLRDISQDFALEKYTVVVIDEAHERSVNTDILIGMLSRIVPLRQDLSRKEPERYVPLKLVIMSATLRVTDFLMNERLFRKAKPPIIEAEGRQYPVTEHFARKTQRDYAGEMVRKVARGHKKLPPGDMLVFLTGSDEIQTVSRRLREQLTAQSSASFQMSKKSFDQEKVVNDYLEDEGNNREDDEDSETEITGLDDDDENEFAVEADAAVPRGPLKAHILPLYATLPKAQQDLVFEKTPDGARKIVLATNVAETSLTIDGIKYVFDCGRSKEKVYDMETGVQEFKIDWISKASASQRMGRAGRTGPGHCYRLYSSAIYEQYFEKHTLPEILRTPLESTVLQLKTLNIEKVVNFPYPTPPAAEQLAQAEQLLRNLGAIDSRGKVTDTGKELIKYPVNPRFGKMLLLGMRNKILAHTIALVAGLAVGDLFIPEPRINNKDEEDGSDPGSDSDRANRRTMAAAAQTAEERRRQAYGRAHKALARDDKSDAIKILTAVGAHAQAELEKNTSSFCSEYFLREKGMSEVQQLRRQLHNIMQANVKDPTDIVFKADLPAPTDKDIALLKQIVAAGYIDQVAIRRDLLPVAASTGRKARRPIEVAYRTLQPTTTTTDHQASIQEQEQQRNVFVHASSVLARLSVTEMPAYVVYANLSRAAAKVVDGYQRTRMHPLTTVAPKQLAALAEGTPLLDVGKPLGKVEELGLGKRQCWVSIALRDPTAAGAAPWPLPAWKVVQVKKGKEWAIEKVLDRGK